MVHPPTLFPVHFLNYPHFSCFTFFIYYSSCRICFRSFFLYISTAFFFYQRLFCRLFHFSCFQLHFPLVFITSFLELSTSIIQFHLASYLNVFLFIFFQRLFSLSVNTFFYFKFSFFCIITFSSIVQFLFPERLIAPSFKVSFLYLLICLFTTFHLNLSNIS